MINARRIKRRSHKVAEINITAFMNLMVVLAPFLLMTAVFTQITVLDLNLPALNENPQTPDPEAMQLRISISEKTLVVSDSRNGVIKQIERSRGQPGFKQLHATLKQIKARIPVHTAITILSQPDTSYDDLVQVMDVSRSYRARSQGRWIRAELFPDISLGDAEQAKGEFE